jgi:hypothetical protein
VLPWVHGAAYAVLVAAPFASSLPPSVWSGLLAVPFSVHACWHTWREPMDFYRRRAVQPASLLAFCTYALGSGIGVLFA